MKTLLAFNITLLVLMTSCKHYGEEMSFDYYIYIDGDTTKKIAIEYPEIEAGIPDQNTVNLIKHDSVRLPFKAVKILKRYGDMNKDFCYLKIKTDGIANIRAVLYDIEVKAKDGWPIRETLMNEPRIVGKDTAKFTLYPVDSIFSQLRQTKYPCIIDIKQGQSEGYATLIDYWNSKKQ